MDNKVYYGEYSLTHWIDLILKRNILLPWYQRSFVWEKSQIDNLIKTLENNQFIPPIIIGAVREEGEWKNYILDGQQRLTSILFAKLNKYVDTKEYLSLRPHKKIEGTADDLPENEDEPVDENIKMIKWNFNEIIAKNKPNSRELELSFYKKLLETEKDDIWFNKKFLGFAYIKPSNDIKDEDQSKFYSDIFRNINIGGSKLTRLEARKALYFLKEDLKNFFVPQFLDGIKVVTSNKESGLIDFIKYLSILSQYNGNDFTIQKYGGRDWEKNEYYYHKYIMAVVDSNSNSELKFNISYPTIPYNNERIEKLKKVFTQLGISKFFGSIIDMDMYFFGLVNEIIFLNNELDEAKKECLKSELDQEIKNFKNETNILHRNNPAALKYLKQRINSSCYIYSKIRRSKNA